MFQFDPGYELGYELYRRGLEVVFTPDDGGEVSDAGSLVEKMATFDRHGDTAFRWLLDFMETHQDELLTLARARHITGHWVYGDGRMYEYDVGRLTKEIAEEIADALVYSARRLSI